MKKVSISQALVLAKSYIERDNILEATELLNGVLQANPTNKIALKLRQRLSDLLAAQENQLDPPVVLLNNVKQSYHDKDFKAALSAAENLIIKYPSSVPLWNVLGAVNQATGRYSAAIRAFENALSLSPNSSIALCNLGVCYKNLGRLKDAASCYEKAIKISSSDPSTYYGLALVKKGQKDPLGAIKHLDKALELKDDFALARMARYELYCQICDFKKQESEKETILSFGCDDHRALPTLQALVWEDNPSAQLERSLARAKSLFRMKKAECKAELKKDLKLKIGFFGADFHEHATLFLMLGLFRELDEAMFEVNIYSYGAVKNDRYQQELTQYVSAFFDVSDLSDFEIFNLSRSHNLKVAIDLKGYTQHGRLAQFQFRIAPVQMSFLGYPGSLGAPFIDYIIADPIIITPETRMAYSESVIYLPHSYQPNDNQRVISSINTTRLDFGLPHEAFVLCCFNNTYKIGFAEFKIWMRVLQYVPGSVLWLMKSNQAAEHNLRRYAHDLGVDPSRLVFAEPLPHAQHLARHQHADLFVDTFFYNAHTTASDALWSGLPIVTKKGQQFAARVAASLLTAVDMPELITYSNEEYEESILSFAVEPQKLVDKKSELRSKIKSAPLFDTSRYARNFERAIQNAYEKFLCNHTKSDLRVKE